MRIRPLSRTARTISEPSRTRGASPCRTAFSTSGWTMSSGTRASATSGARSTVTSRRSAKRALDVEIALDDLQFLGQRGVTIAGIEHVAEQIAERGRQAHDARRVARARQRRDAVQAVEQEMRLQVSAQGLQPRRGQFRLQPRGRDAVDL